MKNAYLLSQINTYYRTQIFLFFFTFILGKEYLRTVSKIAKATDTFEIVFRSAFRQTEDSFVVPALESHMIHIYVHEHIKFSRFKRTREAPLDILY